MRSCAIYLPLQPEVQLLFLSFLNGFYTYTFPSCPFLPEVISNFLLLKNSEFMRLDNNPLLDYNKPVNTFIL